MSYCHVSRQCADHAHRLGLEQDKEAALEKRVDELMEEDGDCEPLEPNNFSESIGAADELELSRVCYLLKTGKLESAANMLIAISHAYQLSRAQKIADKELKENPFFD